MTRPDDIPQGVWDDACRRCENFEGEQSETEIIGTVARAIIGETQRCLKLCDDEIELAKKFGPHHIPIIVNIAAAISSRP